MSIRRHLPPFAACAWLLLIWQADAEAAAASAPRGSAYRCTSAQGTVSYSQQPCAADAKGQLVRAQDDRSDTQRRQGEAVLARDKKLANASARQTRRAKSPDDPDSGRSTGQEPGSLSGPIKQVAVGQREVDRRGATTERLRPDPRHFRAVAPRKAAQSASSAG
jgi:hypothetical protein